MKTENFAEKYEKIMGRYVLPFFILLAMILMVFDVNAACITQISRANNSANSVLTSTKYNLDINTVYTKVNDLEGSCITDGTITSAKLASGIVTKPKLDTTTTSFTNELSNLGLTATVAANALTFSLKGVDLAAPSSTNPVTAAFRAATATVGAYAQRSITSALTFTISSGSTFGHRNGVELPFYIYLLDNSGTPELAVSSVIHDEGTLQSTTAEGGAGTAASASVLYSTTARTSKPIRLIARALSTQATAGTYVTAISEISFPPFRVKASAVRLHSVNGHGATNTKIRRYSTTRSYLGSDITYTDHATNGATFYINRAGIYSIVARDVIGGASNIGISVNSTQLTTDINSINELDVLCQVTTAGSGIVDACPWTGPLSVGDVVRSHTSGGASSDAGETGFTISGSEY